MRSRREGGNGVKKGGEVRKGVKLICAWPGREGMRGV